MENGEKNGILLGLGFFFLFAWLMASLGLSPN